MTHTHEEREVMLRAMRRASGAFYSQAVRIGCHAFIELTGLMNEYIKLCEAAQERGEDFTQANKHSSARLEIPPYSADYIHEKLECMFGEGWKR